MFKKLICPIAIILIIAGCSKSTPTPPPTTLSITVQNSNGSLVSGATVYLFSSANDMSNAFQSGNFNGAFAVQSTSSSGVAVFNSNLSAIQYYYYVKNGCENNYFSGNLFSSGKPGSSTSSPLVLNQNNNSSCILLGVGTLQLVNNSSNPYAVYTDDNQIQGNMQGNSSITYSMFPAGPFEIEWKQLSGYIRYPTIDSTSVTLGCGSSYTVQFP